MGLKSRLSKAGARLASVPRFLPRTAKGTVFGAALAAVLAGGAGAQLIVQHLEALPADAAFRIGHSVTTVDELQQRGQMLSALYGVQRPTDPIAANQYDRALAKSVATSDLLDTAAHDRGIVIADKAASDQLDKVVQQSGATDRSDFAQKLGALGLSEPQVLDEIKRQLADAQLYDQITKGAKQIGDADVTAYYNAHQAQIATPEQRQLRNIVVATRQDADAVLAQVRSGADFAAVASQKSLDQSTKDKGGDLGTVAASQLDQGYAQAAFAAAPNALFGPVQTQYGWNVGQVVAVRPGQPLTLEAAHDDLKNQLQQQEQLGVWNNWLRAQLTAAKIEYAGAFRPADPDAPDSSGAPRP